MIDTDIWQKQVESLNADSYKVRCTGCGGKAAQHSGQLSLFAAELGRQDKQWGRTTFQSSVACVAPELGRQQSCQTLGCCWSSMQR